MDSSARVEYLYTGRLEQPRYFGAASSAQTPRSDYRVAVPVGSPTFSAGSAVSSSYRSRRESESSRTSSSTNATSVLPPAFPPFPTLNQQLQMAPYSYGYQLPCEFAIVGCQVRYDPADIELWIRHSMTHFVKGVPLPSKAICTFCDESDGVFETRNNLESNWRRRMMHIADHFQDLQREEELRPDFGVIRHMEKHGLISKAELENARRYTERPRGCDGIVARGHRTAGMIRRDEVDSRILHDLKSERRQRRKDAEGSTGRRH